MNWRDDQTGTSNLSARSPNIDALVPYGLQDFEDDQDRDEWIDDPLEEAMSNCGMLPDGICMKAGSEECDWECPFS